MREENPSASWVRKFVTASIAKSISLSQKNATRATCGDQHSQEAQGSEKQEKGFSGASWGSWGGWNQGLKTNHSWKGIVPSFPFCKYSMEQTWRSQSTWCFGEEHGNICSLWVYHLQSLFAELLWRHHGWDMNKFEGFQNLGWCGWNNWCCREVHGKCSFQKTWGRKVQCALFGHINLSRENGCCCYCMSWAVNHTSNFLALIQQIFAFSSPLWCCSLHDQGWEGSESLLS